MFTIYDYIDYYKDTKIDDVKWNIADNLICAILCYLNIKSFSNKKNLKDLYDYSLKNKENYNGGFMVDKSFDILDKVKNSIRYRDLFIYDFTNIRNNETQFGAVTFKINNITIIAFKGTDGSLIGWIENFRLLYSYPTITQNYAINYLNNHIKYFDYNDVYVVGHSKGGNLAMVSTMEAKNYIYKRIKNIINFDGPGFRYEEYNSNKYLKVKDKLINIIPSGSIVGTLLENDNFNVIKSNEIAYYQHYPTSWLMFGQYFISNKLSNISAEIHQSTSTNIRNLDKEKAKESFEMLYQKLNKEYSSDFSFSLKDLYKIYQNLKDVDPKIKNDFDKVIDTIMK